MEKTQACLVWSTPRVHGVGLGFSEGMEKKIQPIITGCIGATIKITLTGLLLRTLKLSYHNGYIGYIGLRGVRV